MRISDGSSDVCSSDLHAVRQAMPDVPDEAQVLVLYGDVPLITTATLQRLLAADGRIAVLVADLEDPTGYGRIVRDPEGRVGAIVEHKDATEEQRHIRTINRSEEHTSELQSLMRISYAVFCLKKTNKCTAMTTKPE